MHMFCRSSDGHSAQVEVGELRDDIAPSWLRPPLSVEATAERYVRPHLRQVSGSAAQAGTGCSRGSLRLTMNLRSLL